MKAKIISFLHKETGVYFALTLETIMTVEEMLEELTRNEVGITIFNPHAFGKNYGRTHWSIKLEKSNEGMALKIESDETYETLFGAVTCVYNLWRDTMRQGVAQRLGFPQIEHKREYTQDELASDTDLDDGNTPVGIIGGVRDPEEDQIPF